MAVCWAVYHREVTCVAPVLCVGQSGAPLGIRCWMIKANKTPSLESPADLGGGLSVIVFWSCISLLALCFLMFTYKRSLACSVLDEKLTHLKFLGPEFDSRSFQFSCFPLFWIRDSSQPLYRGWRWALPFHSNSTGCLFRNSPDLVRIVYFIHFWSCSSINSTSLSVIRVSCMHMA